MPGPILIVITVIDSAILSDEIMIGQSRSTSRAQAVVRTRCNVILSSTLRILVASSSTMDHYPTNTVDRLHFFEAEDLSSLTSSEISDLADNKEILELMQILNLDPEKPDLKCPLRLSCMKREN